MARNREPALASKDIIPLREVLEQLDLLLNVIDKSKFVIGGPDSNLNFTFNDCFYELVKELEVRKRLIFQHRPVSPLADIPDEPNASVRAQSLLPVITKVVNHLDANPTGNLKRFLLHVAWHEGKKLTTRKQDDSGPAKSFYQFEAFRAKEAVMIAKNRQYVDYLAEQGNITSTELLAAAALLPSYSKTDPSCSFFPAGNKIGELLEANDYFGSALCRIAFKKVSDEIGTSNAEHAAYWYDHWKISGGNRADLIQTFTAECDEVDTYIVALATKFTLSVNGTTHYSFKKSGSTWTMYNDANNGVIGQFMQTKVDDDWIWIDDGAKMFDEWKLPLKGGRGMERYYRGKNSGFYYYGDNWRSDYL